MALAETVGRRVAAAIARYGEPLTITSGASSRTVTAQVGVMGSARRFSWFTQTEVSAWTLPAVVVRVAGADPAAIGDTLTRDGRTFAVQKIEYGRVRGVVVQTLLMCA